MPNTHAVHLTAGQRHIWRKSVYLISSKTLTHELLRVLGVLESYADPDGTSIFPKRATVAAELGVSVKTVDRGIRFGIEHGWLECTKSKRKRVDGSWTRNVYRLTLPAAVLAELAKKAREGEATSADHAAKKSQVDTLPAKKPQVEPSDITVSEQDQTTTKTLNTSPSLRCWTTLAARDARTQIANIEEAQPIPSDWQPNPQNGSLARTLGLPLDFHAEVFADWARNTRNRSGSPKCRRDWHKAFGRYLNDQAANNAEDRFTGIAAVQANHLAAQVETAIAQLAAEAPKTANTPAQTTPEKPSVAPIVIQRPQMSLDQLGAGMRYVERVNGGSLSAAERDWVKSQLLAGLPRTEVASTIELRRDALASA